MNAIVPARKSARAYQRSHQHSRRVPRETGSRSPAEPGGFNGPLPGLAEPLKACLASLEFLHGASLSLRDPGAPELPSATGCQTDLGRLGDFQLVREIGRGGMGVVYEAEQI